MWNINKTTAIRRIRASLLSAVLIAFPSIERLQADPLTPSLSQPQAGGSNHLDAFIKSINDKGVQLIDGYKVQHGVVYIQLDDSVWSSFDKDHQIRICNALAQIPFLDDMNLTLALLTLDNGATQVGKIAKGWTPGTSFIPNDDYWKYR